MTNKTGEFLNKSLEEYLQLDPNGDYILKSFYKQNQTIDELLETKKQEIEDNLLDWLWFAKPTNKRFVNQGLQIILYFEDEISLEISDGVYYFNKTYYSKDDMQSDKMLTFAIITPNTKNYNYFTSYLQKIVLESFNHNEEKQTILDNIDKVKTKEK